MKCTGSGIRISATDLSNHLACRHVTTLDLQVAQGKRRVSNLAAPDLVVIRERGRPDVLRRLAKHSAKWDWSYEAVDTKLARETRAATILQLALYSELLGGGSGMRAGMDVGDSPGRKV